MSDYHFAACYLQNNGYPEHPNDIEHFEKECALFKRNPDSILAEMKAILDERERWEKERWEESVNADYWEAVASNSEF
jgi:hypothetical protein